LALSQNLDLQLQALKLEHSWLKKISFAGDKLHLSLTNSSPELNSLNWTTTSKSQNSFYVALPYDDIASSHTKPEARSIIPWFKQAFVRDGQSVLKNKWITIRKGSRVYYAKWEDVGPFQVDHWQYVFGNERPRPNVNRDAGIDLSPAVRDYLGMSGMDQCDWKFLEAKEIPQGPWKCRDNSLLSARLFLKKGQSVTPSRRPESFSEGSDSFSRWIK
jgi:hypothetical protein